MDNKQTNRLTQIDNRLSYLRMELIHNAYHDGYVIKGFEEEVSLLIKEREELILSEQ